MAINTPTKTYRSAAKNWKLPVALYGGTRAMRNVGIEYLPKEPKESDLAYKRRLEMTFLFNAFRAAVSTNLGKIFSEEIKVDGVSDSMQAELNNCDNQGADVHGFFKDIAEEAFKRGLCHVLVDSPKRDNVKTEADRINQNLRPYFVKVLPEQLIGWKYEVINNVCTLTEVRIAEKITLDLDNYEQKEVNQVRLIKREQSNCTFELWRSASDGSDGWYIEDSGVIGVKEIPLKTYYKNKTGLMTGECPLMDLAYMNLRHWQSSSDQNNILHVARVPRLMLAGFSDEEQLASWAEHGVDSFVATDETDADAKWIEVNGNAIKHGLDDLNSIEEKMLSLSLEPMIKRTGSETATGKAIDAAKSNSMLQSWSKGLKATISDCLNVWLEFSQQSYEFNVFVNDDFSIIDKPQEMAKVILEWYSNGLISHKTALTMAKKIRFLDDDLDVDEELEGIAEEMPLGVSEEANAA